MTQWITGSADPTNGTFLQGVTNYIPLSGCMINNVLTTEALAQTLVRATFTASNLWTNVTANNGTQTLTLRKNGGGVNNTISISSTGTKEDVTHTDSLASGDLIDVQIVVGGSHSNQVTLRAARILLDDSGANCSPCNSNSGQTSTNQWTISALSIPPGGSGIINSTESVNQASMPVACKLSNLHIYLNANSFTGSTTFISRINTANGNQSISVASASTGLKEDTSNSDILAPGALFCIGKSSGGTSGSATSTSAGYHMAAVSQLLLSCALADTISAASTTMYRGILGYKVSTATESDSQIKAGISDLWFNLEVSVASNSRSDATTLDLRANAASPTGGPAISIASSATGLKTDLTGRYISTSTDSMNFRETTGGGAGSIQTIFQAVAVGEHGSPPFAQISIPLAMLAL